MLWPLNAFMRIAFNLSVFLAVLLTGCASRTPRADNTLVVTVPRVERIDVRSLDGNKTAINRLLSARAESYAAFIGCKNVWYGDGLSMEPLIAPGSWIVTRTCPFDELQPGMVVLYTNTSGRSIAHALVRRTGRGWIAAGVNNTSIDPELVTPSNLAGVITAVFTALPSAQLP